MEQRITGSLNVTLDPVTVAPVTPPGAYLGAAESLMPGVILLAASHTVHCMAVALLAGHVLECLLKALLSKRGVREEELKKAALRHNLAEMWRRAATGGPPFTSVVPAWVDRLNGLHDRPFCLRYPMGVHGLVLPATQPMAEDLAALLVQVREAVR